MPRNKDDAAYLWDMLDAAKTVRDITRGVDLHRYLADRTIQLATERLIEIIGEAARFVSAETRQTHSAIPWTKIVAQRHVLAHHYGAIQHERLWRVISDHIPELIAALTPMLPPDPSDAS